VARGKLAAAFARRDRPAARARRCAMAPASCRAVSGADCRVHGKGWCLPWRGRARGERVTGAARAQPGRHDWQAQAERAREAFLFGVETTKKARRLADAGSSTPHALPLPLVGVRARAGGGARSGQPMFAGFPVHARYLWRRCLCLCMRHVVAALSPGSQCRPLFCVGFGACLCSCTYVGCPPLGREAIQALVQTREAVQASERSGRDPCCASLSRTEPLVCNRNS
jgi:hypothetical protein